MEMMSISTFSVESMIHGYHEYKVVWDNPIVGEDLLCKHEVGNPHDMHMWPDRFFLLCWGGENLTPTQKKRRPGLTT